MSTPTKRRRKTDLENLCEVLRAQDGHRMRAADLHAVLRGRDARWDDEKFARKLDEALLTCPVNRVSGPGGFLSYSGDERSGGAGMPNLYRSVGRILKDHGLLGCRCRQRDVFLTARLQGVAGKRWLIPDFALCCHPKPTAKPSTTVVHTIEVATASGFSIESIYQAHAQGRGSDYSWVLFSRGKAAAGGLLQHSDAERIMWAAAELGVGLISFSKANSINTWTVLRKADRRERTLAQHDAITTLVGRAARL